MWHIFWHALWNSSWLSPGNFIWYLLICIYIYIYIRNLFLQGAQVWLWFLCQRRRPEVTVISKGDVPLTYLQWFDRLRQEAKPRTSPNTFMNFPLISLLFGSWSTTMTLFYWAWSPTLCRRAYCLGNLRRNLCRRWHYFWLINFSNLILFYLMSIQVMEISRRTSIIRGLYDVG